MKQQSGTGVRCQFEYQDLPKVDWYEFADLKKIPIVNVARDLGLRIYMRGGNPWCRIRPEDHTPSVILHPDKNTYHEFGGAPRTGDVIDFVCYAANMSLDRAQEWLGQNYGMTPKNQKGKQQNRNEMALWEYDHIGIAGDLATKNFRYDIDNLPIEVIAEISERYAMSMNELRQKHPKTYASILTQTAIPHVSELRNDYLLSVWSLYELMKEIGNPDLFNKQCREGAFDAQIKELEQAERSLSKAARGTKLKLREPGKYDPIQDLESMTAGKLKPRLGNLSYDQMQKRSDSSGYKVKYEGIEYTTYRANRRFDDFPHTAFLRSGTVIVGYLECDHDKFLAVTKSREKPLDDQISQAGFRTETSLNTKSMEGKELSR